MHRPLLRASLVLLCLLSACARGQVNNLDSGLITDDLGSNPDGATKNPDRVAPDAATPACTLDDDCRSSLVGPVCDTTSGRCVGCVTTRETCAAGFFCNASTLACERGCNTDTDCGSGGVTRCDAASHRCIGCTADADCAPGTLCQSGACVPGCNDGHPCGVGNTCCAGQCADLASDRVHCGACETACGEAMACCAGACVGTAADPTNCGRCGLACSVPNGTAACMAGACAVGMCADGRGDCDRDVSNGCESELAGDLMNCGACGRACVSGASATARCVMGACAVECAGGTGDCDRAAANGCESALLTDPANCGMCGHACPAGPNSTATCASGACGVSCETNFGDCDGDPGNGCEVLFTANAANCGGCGIVCRVPNAMAVCAMGRCGVGTCNPGFADCDHDPANGCEVPVTSDSTNCGACGMRCGAGTACSMGACSSVCASGQTFCGGRCTDVAGDPANCGGCGNACAAGANATATCAGGACGVSCATGFADCDGNPVNGCETSTRDDVNNCGACRTACSIANATPVCQGAVCRVGSCASGFSNCNGSDADGCEVNLRGDVMNCGGCGRACGLPNASSNCAAASCVVGSCLGGFSNCDGLDANGCETALANDNNNCGACGRICGPGTACSGGTCGSVCAAPTVYCGGACANLQTDARNCGACGNVCPSDRTCVAGACTAPGPANDTCAGAVALSLATSQVTLTGSNVNATMQLAPSCGFNVGGDVYYRIDIPAGSRQLVYADTFGSAFDTVLYFASSCGATLTTSTTPGDIVCNDDANTCSGAGLQSQVVALLSPGTWYLVVGGYNGQSGVFNLRVQHLPVGNGALAALGAGATSPAGTTGGAGLISDCAGGGPENSYWWRTCPNDVGGAFSATTCSRAGWDTVLYLHHGSGAGNVCNDDACSLQSSISGSVPAGPGIHVLTVDGYSSVAYGGYTVAVTRP